MDKIHITLKVYNKNKQSETLTFNKPCMNIVGFVLQEIDLWVFNQ